MRSRRLEVESLEERALLSTSILVFSKTTGFRHESIPDGIAAIQTLGKQHGFAVDATEDAADFTDENLGRYQAVVFLLTTGDVLNASQQAAFERFIRAGNGWVGVHSAADTEYDWAWYGGLLGAYFQSHPDNQTATIRVEDFYHPASLTLPAEWVRHDEWYNYQTNPRAAGVTVLATLDESTYSGGTMGADHPIMWYRAYDGGRSWYTGGGHTSESYTEPLFVQSLLGGIHYAIGSPLFVAAFPASPGQVDLYWTDFSGAPVTSYVIERSLDGKKFGRIATVEAGVGAYSDLAVTPGTTYFYRIYAKTTEGSTGYSNTTAASTPESSGGGPGEIGRSSLGLALLGAGARTLRANAAADQVFVEGWEMPEAGVAPTGETRQVPVGQLAHAANVVSGSLADTGLPEVVLGLPWMESALG